MTDQPTRQGSTPDCAEVLSSLVTWLEGMSFFIAASKSQWRDAPTGHYLLAQRLRKDTQALKQEVMRLRSAFDDSEARS